MLTEFQEYLRSIGKSQNTALGYPSAWQAEPRVIICGWLPHFAKTRIWDNDTSVTRGPATMKAGR